MIVTFLEGLLYLTSTEVTANESEFTLLIRCPLHHLRQDGVAS